MKQMGRVLNGTNFLIYVWPNINVSD